MTSLPSHSRRDSVDLTHGGRHAVGRGVCDAPPTRCRGCTYVVNRPLDEPLLLPRLITCVDGAPLQIRAGEMHPARIPAEYRRHQIRMAKALGLKTIATYVF
jgi:hypothetical protein